MCWPIHGAWMLYLAGAAYRILPSIHWLLASQALALSCTACWSIKWLAKQAGLGPRSQLAGLQSLKEWWLQPVVFNAASCLISPGLGERCRPSL